ncbi:MAG TPA: S8 family serine peptidase [Candidatus Saccharimonadia bacterium]|nr:S8 family serine peptidase [Candidatus Saccharimonadia bacterium]
MSHAIPYAPRKSRLSRSICTVLAMSAVIAGGASAAPAQRSAGSGFALAGAESPLAAAMLDSSLLHLRAGTFDPLVTQLAPPAPALAPAGETRYGIAQFRPGRMPSQSRLAALGVDVVAYLPDNAYLVRWNGARAAIAALPETRWTGSYLPGYKFDPTLWSAPVTDLTLIGFPGTDADRFSATLEKRIPGLIRIARYDDPHQPRVHVRVPLAQLNTALVEVAKLEEVLFIEPYAAPELLNDDSYGPIQANVASDPAPAVTADTPIWNRGITGSGQIVTVADSGLDRNHCSFVQLNKGGTTVRAFTDAVATTPPAIAALFPDRKVIGYWTQPGATAYDNSVACVSIGAIPSPTSFHGTHVVGTVLGDRGNASTPALANYDEEADPPAGTEVKPGDGMAPNAQVLFQDIGHDETGCLSGIGVLNDMFQQARAGGARIHTNSWGAATKGVYTGFDADADRGVYNHEDMLVVFAAGNSGAAATTTGSPANAKNVLTVGANAHGNAATIASFSSRGPTADGRTKPEVTAPGSAIVSARGDNINDGVPLDQVETTQCAAWSLSGTSMAAPTVAGGAALMRQYFSDGFYPTGSRATGDAYSPSGALMKAVLMNGTSMPATLPNQTFGWGRIWLDANLYFPGDDRKLRHFDVMNGAGLETGEEQVWTIEVPPGTPRELRATLTWFDPPGTPAAAKALVNDLDLEVVAPNGTFLGNVFTVDASTAGGTRDSTNNTEVVRLKTASQGTYTLRVRGTSVPGSGLEGSTRQGYALAVSSATCATQVAAAPAAPVATDLGLAGVSVAVAAPANATTTQVYRAAGTCQTPASGFRLIGATAGGTFVDPKVTGGFPYAYRVRGADVCGEGPISSCTEVVSTAACDLVPSFDVGTVTATNDPSGGTCGTLVAWSAGAARCPSATGVRYNVYRSTAFDFTPGPTNLIASGVAATSYRDVAVDPLTTYFYVVRAEDSTTDGTGPANGGNETTATRRVNVVAHGPMVPGTYADSVDTAAFMKIESPWAISNDAASDGTLSYRSAADGATIYLPEQCAAITTPPILLGAGSPSLSYDAKWNLEDQWDGVVVEISDDGGATWDDLPPSPTYPSTFAQTQAPPVNACGYAATHGAFGGSSGGVFTSHSSALSSYAGRTVQLRWRFSSDPATEEAGFFLDKLRITNASTAPTCTRVNLAPSALGDAATVVEDSGTTAIDVLANDTDPDGGPKSIIAVTQPANGVVAITGGGTGLSFTPNANFCSTSPESFSYTLNGGSVGSVGVTVTCVDDPPTAVADAATVAQRSSATAIAVLGNDTDVDAGPRTIVSTTQPANGTVAITGGGSGLTYTPNAAFCGTTPDTFAYTLNGNSSATVSVTVTCVSLADALFSNGFENP